MAPVETLEILEAWRLLSPKTRRYCIDGDGSVPINRKVPVGSWILWCNAKDRPVLVAG